MVNRDGAPLGRVRAHSSAADITICLRAQPLHYACAWTKASRTALRYHVDEWKDLCPSMSSPGT